MFTCSPNRLNVFTPISTGYIKSPDPYALNPINKYIYRRIVIVIVTLDIKKAFNSGFLDFKRNIANIIDDTETNINWNFKNGNIPRDKPPKNQPLGLSEVIMSVMNDIIKKDAAISVKNCPDQTNKRVENAKAREVSKLGIILLFERDMDIL